MQCTGISLARLPAESRGCVWSRSDLTKNIRVIQPFSSIGNNICFKHFQSQADII